MGTNYYFKPSSFNAELSSVEMIHIGKSSSGWSFSFHGYKPPSDLYSGATVMLSGDNLGSYDGILYRATKIVLNLQSKEDWFKFLEKQSGDIVNEYGNILSLDSFKEIIAMESPDRILSNGKKLQGHADVDPINTITDNDGYSISFNEFC